MNKSQKRRSGKIVKSGTRSTSNSPDTRSRANSSGRRQRTSPPRSRSSSSESSGTTRTSSIIRSNNFNVHLKVGNVYSIDGKHYRFRNISGKYYFFIVIDDANLGLTKMFNKKALESHRVQLVEGE
jgi:hypothetical protein